MHVWFFFVGLFIGFLWASAAKALWSRRPPHSAAGTAAWVAVAFASFVILVAGYATLAVWVTGGLAQ